MTLLDNTTPRTPSSSSSSSLASKPASLPVSASQPDAKATRAPGITSETSQLRYVRKPSSVKSSEPPPVDPESAAKTAHGESLKERFFRSLKAHTKANESSLPSSKASVAAKATVNPGSLAPAIKETRSEAAAAVETHKAIEEAVLQEETEDETTEEEMEEDHETIENMDTNSSTDVRTSRAAQSSAPVASEKPSPAIGVHGKPLIKPMYVVRPAPPPEDCVESDDEEDADSSEDGEEEEEEVRRRKRVMRKHLRNFRRPLPPNLALERDVLFPTLRFLTRNEVLVCSRVCKAWNSWTSDPSLWTSLSASGKAVTPPVLVSIVRRQPLDLDLSWTRISKRQLAWLLPRVPQLRSLSLSGCSAAAAVALASCQAPLIKSLDLSWVDALDDELMHELMSPPLDQRPGLAELKTRLRLLQELNLAGADVTDDTLSLLAQHLPHLLRVDLSNCSRITDKGIASLIGSCKTSKLTSIVLYGCERLTDRIFESFKNCSHLMRLDLRNCDRISIAAFTKFFQLQSSRQFLLTQAQNKLMCVRR